MRPYDPITIKCEKRERGRFHCLSHFYYPVNDFNPWLSRPYSNSFRKNRPEEKNSIDDCYFPSDYF
jgi:hypothetical protein